MPNELMAALQALSQMRPVASHAAGPEVTLLTPSEELRFQRWAQANQIRDVDHPDSYYDYRGYWKEYGDRPIRFGVDHFTDTYKQHGHPRFSTESKYSRGLQDGGRWLSESLIPPPGASHERAKK